MGAVTYPDQQVAQFVTEMMVPIQVLSDSALADEFKVKWTPTIVVLDYYGKEHHRTVGFFPPGEFIPSLILGIGMIDFDADQFNEAIIRFDRLLGDFPQSKAAPEALYHRWVSCFKASHDANYLKEAYVRLKAGYPDSEWTQRAEPYSLL
jgi:hypothetical protein